MMQTKPIATRESYGRTLAQLGAENDKIVVLDADLAESTKTCMFQEKFPERHFDCGIAEGQHGFHCGRHGCCGNDPLCFQFCHVCHRTCL